ncbi:glycoside hydrolase family 76 protein [Zopfia rhizophila CBS 207.26]|uniref:mannan endo-1,6-alpha-mannosidase n=1 Tax=Zopfia rhizophila CBS 207.26 TaxID=1314779 RepID=A0A6A6DFH8_9PEZI|nr:glycoside hydrolase family 76 protein [Zopfia rhizophila CBS 207.26]
MKFFLSLGAVLLPLATQAIELNVDDESSIKSVAAKYAHGLMSYYKNNASDTPKEDVGIFPKPHYWWEAGAAWGGMIEYSQFTEDSSYVDTVTQALVANFGPNNDILLPWRKSQEGNDDQAFWALALMSAIEYEFPDPKDVKTQYFDVVKGAFDNIASRWDTSSCNGGLKWQIYPENDYGYNYKNSISNGCFFALAARLARYTGNQTYADWAVKTWDWSKAVGLVSDKYEVFDGTDDKKNCTDQDHNEWSYNIGVYLHGAAALYNYTDGDEVWKKHTSGLLDHTAIFFKPYDNATDIMYEVVCETGETGAKPCNLDQQSFKAYLSRFMAKSAILAPFTKAKITNYLEKSAAAAAKSCSGGQDGVTCGSKWYTGGWDGTFGVGQQLAALEVTQALLTLKQGRAPVIRGDSKPSPSSTATPVASSKAASSAVSSAAASGASPTPSAASPSSATSSVVAVTSLGATTTPVASSTAGAVSSAVNAGPAVSSAVLGGEGKPDAGVCTCTPSSTVTVTVPPTPAAAIPTPPVPIYPNGTVPVNPPANSTRPGAPQFTGAATDMKATSFSMLGAFAVAVIVGVL